MSISNKYFSFELSVQTMNREKCITVSPKNIKQHNCVQQLIIIINVSWAANHHMTLNTGVIDAENLAEPVHK